MEKNSGQKSRATVPLKIEKAASITVASERFC
jgi:hypothetical protein